MSFKEPHHPIHSILAKFSGTMSVNCLFKTDTKI
jgi:hypothetical protein